METDETGPMSRYWDLTNDLEHQDRADAIFGNAEDEWECDPAYVQRKAESLQAWVEHLDAMVLDAIVKDMLGEKGRK